VEGVSGRMRAATREDRDLLVAWIRAFAEEALPKDDPMDPERVVDLRLQGPSVGLVLWEDGDPVALAGAGGPTPNGIRIGPVYTPPAHRRRGYASALVAGLSQRLLDEGRTFCFLHTDLSNPTSNRIYVDIGYEPVCDSRNYRFEATAG
jgi:predicted GNAT family acetyltransferase